MKIVVQNRYKKAKPVIGFIKGFNLKFGAIATCIAHDSHNIVAIGTNEEDILNAINLLNKSKGGIAVFSQELNISELLPLKIGGIISDKTAKEVYLDYKTINEKIKLLGSDFKDPLMSLSFMSLSVIPSLKITASGLIDSNNFKLTDLYF